MSQVELADTILSHGRQLKNACNQGSNFLSGVFQQVMYELGIKQYTSSAYHPQSQGALERFHQTLKSMLRTYCFKQDKDWDEGVHLLLFAARKAVLEQVTKLRQ